MGWANTENGYNRFELLSALQKAIRRGKEAEALRWAAELERHSYPILWNRLEIIASEDIGPADPMMHVKIAALRAQYEAAVTRRSPAYRLFLANAVLMLARSPKSRAVDDLVWTVYWEKKNNEELPEIPDYAQDHHTGKGTVEDWINEGCHLENEAEDIPNQYKERALENLKSGKSLGEKFPRKGRRKKE